MKSKRIICGLTALMMVLATACGEIEIGSPEPAAQNSVTAPVSAEPEKPNKYDPTQLPPAEESETFDKNAASFSAELFKAAALSDIEKGESVMISPVSVMAALGMAAEGAGGSTLSEMAEVLYGGEQNAEDFRNGILAVRQHSAESEQARVNFANSVWYNKADGIQPKQEFIDVLNSYYGAEFSGLAFNDEALGKINGWVSENTNGMIPSIIDCFEPNDELLLVNAVAFEGEWACPYEDTDVIEEQRFTAADGSERTVTMLDSIENDYISGEGCEGFVKYYLGGKYAFMAVLPDEDVSLSDYVSGLNGDERLELYGSRSREDVIVRLPEFTTDYDTSLNESLEEMGIHEAFQNYADFSNMTDVGLEISRVLHKTHIEVDRKGTKAAAATAVMFDNEACTEEQPIKHTVILDRPFLYAIVDCESGLPMFLGAYC